MTRLAATVALCGALLAVAACRPPAARPAPCPAPEHQERIAERVASDLAADLRARVADAMRNPRPTTLTIREEELAAVLGEAAPARVDVRITACAVLLRLDLGADREGMVTLVPATRDGRLVAEVSSITIDGRPLPRLVGAASEAALEALATDAAWSVDIDQVTQSDGVMSVTLGVD